MSKCLYISTFFNFGSCNAACAMSTYLYQGLKKNLNSRLPFREAALKCCLPWGSLSLLLFYLVGRQLAWALVHGASENCYLPSGKSTCPGTTRWNFFRALSLIDLARPSKMHLIVYMYSIICCTVHTFYIRLELF